ncbi:MAG: helix-turn-helix domain-containing protein [Cyclobacteriaceae bacterium]|nr:helix-turn-helix domain-containing protein [Cyclobacteriaceae bacterium]
MHYQRYTPPPELRQYVRYFWSFESRHSAAKKLCIRSFADQYPRLIFQDLNGFDPICNATGSTMPICYLSGLDTRPTEAWMGGCFSHVGVSFYPHALSAFFNIDAHELTNEMPDIRWVCRTEIGEKLTQATTLRERVQLVSTFLYQKLQATKKHDPLVNHLMQTHEVQQSAHVSDLVRKYKVSERQLERKFNVAVGVSPKKLLRIARFEQSLQRLTEAGYRQLTTIAHELHYTDQSHFIKDFKNFSSMLPYEFVRNKSFGSESSSFIYATQ